jgi:hypothetical protein
MKRRLVQLFYVQSSEIPNRQELGANEARVPRDVRSGYNVDMWRSEGEGSQGTCGVGRRWQLDKARAMVPRRPGLGLGDGVTALAVLDFGGATRDAHLTVYYSRR